MSLKHAIIALLDLESGTGYDLVKRFNNSVGHFWSSSHQQVYKELHRLYEEELVEFETIEQEGKPDKKVYSATQKGVESLIHWVNLPTKPFKIKDPLLIKIFAGRYASPDVLLKDLERHEKVHNEAMEAYEGLENNMARAKSNVQKRYLLPYMTLRLGIHLERAWLAWAKEVKSALKSV